MKKIFYLFALCVSANAFGQQTWTQVITPNPSPVRNMLSGIAGTSGNDIWVVGHKQTSPYFAQYTSLNLVIHWDGNGWQEYTTTSPGATYNNLSDVEMVSVNDGWVVGEYGISGGGTQPELHRWNGTNWTQQTLPNMSTSLFLNSISAISANDVWTVGKASNNIPLAIHFDGTNWTTVAVPGVGTFENVFNSVHGLSSNDVWAVGFWANSYGDERALAMHWNGTIWENSAMPAFLQSGTLCELLDVKMISTNDVWAVGSYLTGGMVILHWDGASWTQVTEQGGGGAFGVVGLNDIYAVGEEIAHWNGSNWTLVDSLSQYPEPALNSTLVLPDGEVWAAGRIVDTDTSMKSLVLRSNTSGTSTVYNTSESNMRLDLYPNPVSDDLYVQLNMNKEQKTVITVSNLSGQMVYKQEMRVQAGEQKIHITLLDVADGTYILKVTAGSETQEIKLLKKSS